MDDVHEIPRASASSELIAALAASLPTNGHLVLASRHEPPIPLSRADVQGRTLRLDEGDLAFAPDELARFAALRDIPQTQLDGVGSWPSNDRTHSSRPSPQSSLPAEGIGPQSRSIQNERQIWVELCADRAAGVSVTQRGGDGASRRPD